MSFILSIFILTRIILNIHSLRNDDSQIMYASPNGSNSDDCGTQLDPCRSFQTAFEHASEPSVKVLVSSGSYIQRTVVNIDSKTAQFTHTDTEYPTYYTTNLKSDEAVFNVASGSVSVEGFRIVISQSSSASILIIKSDEEYGSASFTNLSVLAGTTSDQSYQASLFIVDGGKLELTDFSTANISFSSSNIIKVPTKVCYS